MVSFDIAPGMTAFYLGESTRLNDRAMGDYGHDSDARFLGDVNIERRGSSCLTISFSSGTLLQRPRITSLCPTTTAAEINELGGWTEAKFSY